MPDLLRLRIHIIMTALLIVTTIWSIIVTINLLFKYCCSMIKVYHTALWICKSGNYLLSTYDYLGLSKPLEEDLPEAQEVPENLIRNFRPPHLEFRVGNVVLTHAMKTGVIVGWSIDINDLTKEPEYLMLSERYEELIKVDQDQIIIALEEIEIIHEKIDQYFERFDGTGYIPNKSLQKMYPKG